jgi:hypothetical protein
MRAAYAYADEGGRVPLELEAAWRVHDIGAEAVLGDQGEARFIRRIALSEAVYRAFVSRRDYRDKDGAENWAEWAKHYPEQSRLLVAALRESDE